MAIVGPRCASSNCLVLYDIAWYCVVLHGTGWYCMILRGIAMYSMVLLLHDAAWYCMVLRGIAWYVPGSVELNHTVQMVRVDSCES